MASPLYGQITTTGSAQQLDPTQKAASCVAFTIKAPLSNTGAVYVGDSGVTTSTGFQLDAGDVVTYERIASNAEPYYQSRPSDFYVWIVNSGDKVSWLALP